jgi:hypothetical protein
MKKIIYLVSTVAIVLFFISATCDSPIVGDHSGAPGESTCSGCHSAPINPDLPELHFEVDGNESAYVPGNTYLVHLSIKRIGHNKFGFVCSSLDSLNTSKGTFNLINTLTTRKYTMGGRDYISHTPCGADATDSISWTFNWTAPDSNKGKIKIYMSMLVANHDHALTGDTTYTRVISLSPSNSNVVHEISNSQKAKVYPTFFSNNISIDFNQKFNNSTKQILLINADGKVVEQYSTDESKSIFIIRKGLSRGVYLLKINYSNTSETCRLIKE